MLLVVILIFDSKYIYFVNLLHWTLLLGFVSLWTYLLRTIIRLLRRG